jgi:hypothetical protein
MAVEISEPNLDAARSRAPSVLTETPELVCSSRGAEGFRVGSPSSPRFQATRLHASSHPPLTPGLVTSLLMKGLHLSPAHHPPHAATIPMPATIQNSVTAWSSVGVFLQGPHADVPPRHVLVDRIMIQDDSLVAHKTVDSAELVCALMVHLHGECRC